MSELIVTHLNSHDVEKADYADGFCWKIQKRTGLRVRNRGSKLLPRRIVPRPDRQSEPKSLCSILTIGPSRCMEASLWAWYCLVRQRMPHNAHQWPIPVPKPPSILEVNSWETCRNRKGPPRLRHLHVIRPSDALYWVRLPDQGWPRHAQGCQCRRQA